MSVQTRPRFDFGDFLNRVLTIAAPFIIGITLGHMLPHERSSASVTPAELRAGLSAKCAVAPDVLGEINTMLPDNTEGLITPMILRKVLTDVVNHC